MFIRKKIITCRYAQRAYITPDLLDIIFYSFNEQSNQHHRNSLQYAALRGLQPHVHSYPMISSK